MTKKVVIVGSSREGDTSALAERLKAVGDLDVIDLRDYEFTYYDYENRNRDDDYIPLINKLLNQYDTFIFATPVYYYAMSGIMKVFFDRFTDLFTIKKEIGERLEGKKMAAVSSSFGDNLGEDFWLPFSATARYLKMEFLGGLHTIPGKVNDSELLEFLNSLES